MEEKLKPDISKENVRSLIKQYYGLKIEDIEEMNGYDDCNFYCKINDESKSIEMTFKVTNYKESEEEGLLESLNDLSLYVYENGLNVPIPIQNLNGNYLERIKLKNDSKYRNAIRLFTFIPGILFNKVDYTPFLLKSCGKEFAKLNKVLSNYSNSTIEKRKSSWALENVMEIENYLEEIDNLDRQKMIKKILNDFRVNVLEKRDLFTQAIIHDDLNEQNLIVKKIVNCSDDGESISDDDFDLAGILDFNDIVHSIRIFDIGIFCAYCMLKKECNINTIDMPKYILKGYLSNIEVTDLELSIIPLVIKARLCQTLVLGNHFYKLNPTNEYVLETSKTGWIVLSELNKFENDVLIQLWT